MNRFDYDSNEYTITGVCSGAALYGHDGSLWANAGEEGGNLTTYQHPLEQMDGSIENIEVNEVACAVGAADGNRQPSGAGIRMGGEKYMLTYKDDAAAISQMTRRQGWYCRYYWILEEGSARQQWQVLKHVGCLQAGPGNDSVLD